MSLQVLANYPRAALILDPNFYSSTIFVDPLRKDIHSLLESFKTRYTASTPPRYAFSTFKAVWKEQGWEYVHLSEIDDVGRDAFVVNVLRMFLEKINEQEDILIRVAALFALYTFYFSQPTTSIRVQHQIVIPIDIYKSLPTIFKTAPADLSLYITHVLSRLFERHAFLILPPSTASPYDPCKLPRWTLQKASEIEKKKTGRKSKKEKERAALTQLMQLEEMVAGADRQVTSVGQSAPDGMILNEYMEKKKQLLLEILSPEEIEEAERITLERMRDIDSRMMEINSNGNDSGDEKDGLRRVEECVASGSGLLNFVATRTQ